MFSDIVLIHRQGSEGLRVAGLTDMATAVSAVCSNGVMISDGDRESLPKTGDWFFWETCLRKIAFGQAEHLDELEMREGDQIFRGTEAYRLCLEIICGLHSPLVGETEVLGQFKGAVEVGSLPATPWGVEMKRFVRALLEDAKRIRATHLAGLGSQSYGSLLRRELKANPVIHILGGGHLTGEILPWLCKDQSRTVIVHVRSLERAEMMRAKFPSAEFRELGRQAIVETPASFGDKASSTVLASCSPSSSASVAAARGPVAFVIAAPVAAREAVSWINEIMVTNKSVSQERLSQADVFVADLRGNAAADPVPGHVSASLSAGMPAGNVSSLASHSARVLDLAELMSRIDANQERLRACRERALKAVEAAVAARASYIENRPFGWEDVCA